MFVLIRLSSRKWKVMIMQVIWKLAFDIMQIEFQYIQTCGRRCRNQHSSTLMKSTAGKFQVEMETFNYTTKKTDNVRN